MNIVSLMKQNYVGQSVQHHANNIGPSPATDMLVYCSLACN